VALLDKPSERFSLLGQAKRPKVDYDKPFDRLRDRSGAADSGLGERKYRYYDGVFKSFA